jgi:hypothetical protein
MSLARSRCMCARLYGVRWPLRSNLRVSSSRARLRLSCSKLDGFTSLGDLASIFQDFPDRPTPSFMRYLAREVKSGAKGPDR